MKQMYYCMAALFVVILLCWGCSVVEQFHTETNTITKENYAKTMIAKDNLPLFAILDGQPGVQTKSTDIPSELVSLESLLDRSRTSTECFKQYKLKEVPFLMNREPSFAILSAQAPETSDGNYISSIGLFLVETTDTVENIFDYKVVTMIPDEKYMEGRQGEDLSFINKGVFSGTILFSDIDGTFRDIYIYGGDYWPIIDAEIIDSTNRASYAASEFLTVVNFLDTKSADDEESGGELEPSICIAFQESTLENFDTSLGWIDGDSLDLINPDLDLPINSGGGGGTGGIIIGGPGSNIGSSTGSVAGGLSSPISSINSAFIGGKPKLTLIREDVQK